MSLSSLLNTTGSTTSAYTYGNSTVGGVAQTVKDALAKAAAGASSATGSGSATISSAARIAAAEAADNKKDFTALSTEVRSTLDAQYAAARTAGTGEKADLSEMSGRALAAIALNKAGTFSNREIAAARLEMRGRERADFSSQIGSGSGISALAAYNQQIVTQYDDMSSDDS